MTDYISREAALEAIIKHKEEMAKTGGVSNTGKAFYLTGQNHAIDVLCIVPAADVVPVVRGKWVWKPDKRWWECDQCGETTTESVMYKPRFRFCPWCGADMRKEVNNEQE